MYIRQKEIDTGRHEDKWTSRQVERQTGGQVDNRQIETDTGRHVGKLTIDRWTGEQQRHGKGTLEDTKTSGRVDRWTEGQEDKWTGGQVDRWTVDIYTVYIRAYAEQTVTERTDVYRSTRFFAPKMLYYSFSSKTVRFECIVISALHVHLLSSKTP